MTNKHKQKVEKLRNSLIKKFSSFSQKHFTIIILFTSITVQLVDSYDT